jgi:hypothetical protein
MNEQTPHDRARVDALHPIIYATIVALTVWFVISVWVLFGDQSYTTVTDVMVTFLFTMAIGIPTTIWLTWRHHPEARPEVRSENVTEPNPIEQGDMLRSFHRWASGEFSTWSGGQKAWQATIEVLLPIVAVAFGMTAIGIVYFVTAVNVA